MVCRKCHHTPPLSEVDLLYHEQGMDIFYQRDVTSISNNSTYKHIYFPDLLSLLQTLKRWVNVCQCLRHFPYLFEDSTLPDSTTPQQRCNHLNEDAPPMPQPVPTKFDRDEIPFTFCRIIALFETSFDIEFDSVFCNSTRS